MAPLLWNSFEHQFWPFIVALHSTPSTIGWEPQWVLTAASTLPPANGLSSVSLEGSGFTTTTSTRTSDTSKQQALVKSLLWSQCVEVLQGALLMPPAAKQDLLHAIHAATKRARNADEVESVGEVPSLCDVIELLELWQGAFADDQDKQLTDDADTTTAPKLTRRQTVHNNSLSKLMRAANASVVRYWLTRLLTCSSEDAAVLQSRVEEREASSLGPESVVSSVSVVERSIERSLPVTTETSAIIAVAPVTPPVVNPKAPMAPPPWPSNPPPAPLCRPATTPAVVVDAAPTHHHTSPRPFVPTVTPPPSVVSPRPVALSSPLPGAMAPPLIAVDTVLQATLRPLLLPNSGHDAPPKGPLDPEHPQRVVECSADKLSRRMLKFGNTQSYYADLKYDGERLIGFKMGKHYKFFSRNMLEVPVRKLGGVEALLDAAFGAHHVVFDAEILSLHTFGTMNEVSKADIMATGPRIFVFDILWVNGTGVMHRPLRERKQLLNLALNETANVKRSRCYHLNGGVEGCSLQLQSIFDDAMYGGLEGFVLKPTETLYTSGGTHWVKLKRGYMDTSGKKGEHATVGPTLAGLGGGPKIRRVDGVAATTVMQAALMSGSAGDAFKKEVRPIVDTIDCLAVGTVQRDGETGGPLLLLCAIFDSSLNQFVTCGCCKIERSDPILRRRMVPYRRQSLSYVRLGDAPPPLNFVFETPKDCPVVEVRVSALSNIMDGVLTSRLIFAGTADVVRHREDKDSRAVNSYPQLLTFFDANRALEKHSATAAPVTATSTTIVVGADMLVMSIQHAVQQLNDMHWQPLPCATTAALGGSLTPYHCEIVKGSATAEFVKSAALPWLQVLIVGVAPGRSWSDRGVMRDVTKSFGTGPQILSDKRMAVPSASLGDVCALTVLEDRPDRSPHGGCICCVAGVIVIGGGVAKVESSVLDIVLVRVVGMALSVPGVAASSVVVRLDVGSAAEETAVRLSVQKLMEALPVSKRVRVVLHSK